MTWERKVTRTWRWRTEQDSSGGAASCIGALCIVGFSAFLGLCFEHAAYLVGIALCTISSSYELKESASVKDSMCRSTVTTTCARRKFRGIRTNSGQNSHSRPQQAGRRTARSDHALCVFFIKRLTAHVAATAKGRPTTTTRRATTQSAKTRAPPPTTVRSSPRLAPARSDRQAEHSDGAGARAMRGHASPSQRATQRARRPRKSTGRPDKSTQQGVRRPRRARARRFPTTHRSPHSAPAQCDRQSEHSDGAGARAMRGHASPSQRATQRARRTSKSTGRPDTSTQQGVRRPRRARAHSSPTTHRPPHPAPAQSNRQAEHSDEAGARAMRGHASPTQRATRRARRPRKATGRQATERQQKVERLRRARARRSPTTHRPPRRSHAHSDRRAEHSVRTAPAQCAGTPFTHGAPSAALGARIKRQID